MATSADAFCQSRQWSEEPEGDDLVIRTRFSLPDDRDSDVNFDTTYHRNLVPTSNFDENALRQRTHKPDRTRAQFIPLVRGRGGHGGVALKSIQEKEDSLIAPVEGKEDNFKETHGQSHFFVGKSFECE